MENERGDGNGGIRGRGDHADDFAEPEEPTVVISSEQYLHDAIERMARGLRNAAQRLNGLGGMVEQKGAALILDELDEDLVELEATIGGAIRAVRRLKEIEARGGRTK